jgi:phosphoenolpyruvate synthase/pyruvate phosphate dikinase
MIKKILIFTFFIQAITIQLFGSTQAKVNTSTQTSQEVRSLNTLNSWFVLPQFSKGNPIQQDVHRYVISHFGNKTFNLCVLNALAQKLNQPMGQAKTRIAVPEFCAISSQELTEYLNKKATLDLLWQQFTIAQAAHKDLQPMAIKLLSEIRARISSAFIDASNIPAAIKQQIESFIVQHKDSVFMVRSTGDEDRTDIANAGGNESVPAVQPTVQAIWQAMGIVVQSYFSEKSLQQRLLAGDVITKRFFIPVLIQRMIGEKIGVSSTSLFDLPVSGVMFTQESLGDTPNVAQIQTAFGHNQGVVNSLVAVDTFYCGPSGVIHTIIRKKTDRLAPVKTDDHLILERVTNPIALQATPSISSLLAYDLSRIARIIETEYNHPMDIEFVVERKNNSATIYLVQARPLLKKTFTQSPDYVVEDSITKTPEAQLIKGQTLGAAGGFVRRITDSNQIILKDELPQALNEYHDNPERSVIKAVIVTKMAPATSHEATQFRGYAVPVLVIKPEDKQKIEQLLLQGALLIDTQRGLIIASMGDEKVVAHR